tara:strand:+ start:1978 stop:2346 length:369 start_codon:yes stop_codon:yes gene_type:complete
MAIANNMKTKHTNGPWMVADEKYRLRVATDEYEKYSRKPKGIIADVYTGHENAHANTRLIAASPDLLTAVQQLVATLHSTYDVFEDLCKTGNMSANPLDNHVVQDIADQAADALEQATGVRP